MKVKLWTAAAADFQHSLKEVHGGKHKWGIFCSEKNWQNRSSDRYFPERALWAQFLHLLISRNSERDGNTRPPDLPLKKFVCGSGSNRTGHGTTDWFQIGKGVHQDCILSPCLFNSYAEYIMRNAGLDEHKLESRLLGAISITSDMQMTPPWWQKVKRN